MICLHERIASSRYYGWSKEFLQAGPKGLAAEAVRSATSDEVKALRHEVFSLQEAIADLSFENRLLKKSVNVDRQKKV